MRSERLAKNTEKSLRDELIELIVDIEHLSGL
jgi:hypothetical protein